MKGIEQYKKNIQSLIDATNSGKIEWKQQNPTTYYFVGSTGKGDRSLISLQSLFDDYENSIIQLIITSPATKETVLTLNSYSEDLAALLQKLYDDVAFQIEKKGIDYFDDLIKSL
jgi:hypothetical protein